LQLGLHTYCLNLHGLGQSWGGFRLPWPRQLSTHELLERLVDWELDGAQIDDAVLESLDPGYVREVGAEAREKGLFLEYNFSLDVGGLGVGHQHDLGEALDIAVALGADVVKLSVDLVRPRPLVGSRFHPDVVAQMERAVPVLRAHAPAAAERGIRIAVENHTDLFSDELLWLLDEVGHPHVGVCLDPMNALHVTEDPMQAMERLAPRSFTNHFRDERLESQIWGFRLVGCPVGEGDLDARRCYELLRDVSPCERLIIETDLDIPLDDRETAKRMEIDAIERSIRYCRDVLGVGSDVDEGSGRE